MHCSTSGPRRATAKPSTAMTNADEVLDDVEALASWSPWVRFADAVANAPRQPGVYLAREGIDGPIVYVGMAGERAGGGKPQGIRGRLRVYASGKALTSGLGEAVADRAFADAQWLRERVADVERGEPMRAIAWGQAALRRADLHVRWTVTATGPPPSSSSAKWGAD